MSNRLIHRATAAVLLAAFASPVFAAVELRVEARPVSDPIEAYVTVTDLNGNPQDGLDAGDFTLELDGQPITIQPEDLSLPASENPDRSVSVIFVMDYTPSTEGAPREAMQQAVIDFVGSMEAGDYAAIVKFNGTNPAAASVVQEFTEIDDGGAGDSALISAASAPYPGRETNLYDALEVALAHIASAEGTLPEGPRALILISDGLDNSSESADFDQILAEASSQGIAMFTIAVGDPGGQGEDVLEALAARSGGTYTPAADDQAIFDAYASISSLLDNSYLITFESSITDCDPHTLEVTVNGQTTPASVRFTRCDEEDSGGGDGGGGGGGHFGFGGALMGLALTVARRRRRRAAIGHD